MTEVLLLPKYGAVVHCYASVTQQHARTGAWAHLWGEELPTFAQLVVCELPDEPGIHLLGVEPSGHVRFDSDHESISDAKHYAESEYQGLASAWRVPGESRVSDA